MPLELVTMKKPCSPAETRQVSDDLSFGLEIHASKGKLLSISRGRITINIYIYIHIICIYSSIKRNIHVMYMFYFYMFVCFFASSNLPFDFEDSVGQPEISSPGLRGNTSSQAPFMAKQQVWRSHVGMTKEWSQHETCTAPAHQLRTSHVYK